MASAAQVEANRFNAALSCGPTSPEGKARSSRNHLKFGLFSTQNCVRPEETAEYTKVSKALWKDLNPVGAVEELLAVEIVRASWRLHRCAVAEAEDGANPVTQASVDRARASAHASLRRLLNDLRQFQSDRWLRAEVLRDGFNEQYYGIADTHRVIKGLADNERLKSQFLMAPIGIDPINQVGQAISSPAKEMQLGQALSPGKPNERPAPTIRTQSVGQAPRVAGPRERAGAALISPGNPPPAKSAQSLSPQPPAPRSDHPPQRSLPLPLRPQVQALLRRGCPASIDQFARHGANLRLWGRPPGLLGSPGPRARDKMPGGVF